MSERWWIDGAHRAGLEARAPLDVAAWMQPAGDRTVLSTDRQSAAVRWAGPPALLVKWRAPIPGRKGKTFLRTSRERAEARACLRARALDIPCPAPWAVGERRRAGVLVGSVLVRAFDTRVRSAVDAARESPGVLLDVARALRRWHDAGFRHGDCYPKNVLVAGPQDEPQPIGCPKASFVGPGTELDAARLKDLAQFAAGATSLQPWGDPFAFLIAYGEAAGLPGYEALSEQLLPAYERVMERKRERVRTQPEREPGGPPAPAPLAASDAVRSTPRLLPIERLG